MFVGTENLHDSQVGRSAARRWLGGADHERDDGLQKVALTTVTAGLKLRTPALLRLGSQPAQADPHGSSPPRLPPPSFPFVSILCSDGFAMDAAWQSIVSACAIASSSRETAASPSAFAVRERWLRRCERCVPLLPRAVAPRDCAW
jgi:hypothetical protein